MTAPLCLWCNVGTVKKAAGKAKLHCSRAPWRNYCSRYCAGQAGFAKRSPESVVKDVARLNALNRQRRAKFYEQEIRSVLGVGFTGGAITMGQAVQLIAAGYERGWHAAYILRRTA